MQPLFDLRLATSTIFDGITKSLEIFANSTFDFSTILSSTKLTKTTTFVFDKPTLHQDDDTTFNAIATQTTTNEFVIQERHSKIELILSTNEQQTGILTELRHELSDIKAVVGTLVQQRQQHITVKDMKYNPEVFLLKIKGKKDQLITARRERQLCELLLPDTQAMTRKWDIEEMLDHIGEAFTVDMSDYGKWLQKYYTAARRLNVTLLPILGYELLLVDRKNQSLYVNPAFYHN